jgi:hypothetical protein
MKKLILILIMILAFALPALANTITFSAKTNDFVTYTDTTELYLEYKLSEKTTAGFTLTVNDLVFGTPTESIDATLDFIFGNGTAQLGAGYDISGGTSYVKGKILNFSLGDDLKFNTKVKYNFPADTYWAVANVIFNVGEKVDLIVEGRTDSDGAELYSAEAQLTFGLTENMDLTVGYEINGWDDSINDWDAMTISSDAETAYGKIVIRF